jgi:hypothetical protein
MTSATSIPHQRAKINCKINPAKSSAVFATLNLRRFCGQFFLSWKRETPVGRLALTFKAEPFPLLILT